MKSGRIAGVRIDIVSIFVDYLAPLRLSLIGKAIADGRIDLGVHDLRDWSGDRNRRVDDAPYGGGAGMVMRPEPWGAALDAILGRQTNAAVRPTLIVPTPAGRLFDQRLAEELAAQPWLIFACGRYEGIDQRVLDEASERASVLPLSLGDYVLNGGEVAALAIIEATARLLPGVVGNPESLVEESHADGLLEYPVYTRPPSWRGRDVPPVLLGGDHAAIERWRTQQSRTRTAALRPDLLHASQALSVDGLGAAELAVAQPADIPELFVLTRACWVGSAQTLADFGAELPRWTTLVLRSGGRLIGSVRGRSVDESWEVGRLLVAPDLQGRGIGRWLLAKIEDLAPGGAKEIWLEAAAEDSRTLRLFRKAGYRPAPWRPASPGAVGLIKRLGAKQQPSSRT